MTEEEFQKQEQAREKAERKKEALRKGTPMPNSVEEQIEEAITNLFQAKNTVAAIKEYIKCEHGEFHELIESQRNYYDYRIAEQDSAINGLESEVAAIRNTLTEFQDNFNLFASKLLDEQRAHRERVRQSLDKLDEAL